MNRPLRHVLKLTLLTLTLAACELNYTAEEHLRRAQEAERKGDSTAALIELKNAAQKAPRNPEVRALLAEHYVKEGQGAAAEKEIKHALDLGHGIEDLKPLYAEALLQQGLYQRVLDEIQPSDITTPANRARILRAHGDARLGLRQPQEGCPLYAKALELDPRYAEAYWGLARCALGEGRLETAKSHIQAALRVDPLHAGSWVWLGNLERGMGRNEAAIAAYTRALERDPRHRQALYSRAQILALNGKLKEAEADTQALRKLAPDYHGTHFMEALLQFQAGKTDAALDSVQRALKAAPGDMITHLLHAHILVAKGAYESALKTLDAILNVVPAYTEGRKLAAAVNLRLRQPERALALLSPLISANQADAQTLALAGEARLQMADPAAARDLFAQASAHAPQASVLDVKLGLSMLATGDESQGVRILQSAGRDKRDPRAEAALAYYFLAENRFDDALTILAELNRRYPQNPGVLNLMGMAYVGKKEFARARASFEQALALRPGLTSAAVRLAGLDIAEGKLEQARARYEGLLKQDKGNVAAWVGLAELAARRNRETEYLQHLTAAVKADPAAIVPRAMLADYYLSKRQPLKALEQARTAAERNPGRAEAFALLARIQLAAGERAGALSAAKQMVALRPDSAEAHYQLAQAHAAQGDAQATRAALNRALALDASHLQARVALTRLETRTGRLAEAIRQARELQARAPQSPLGFELEGDAQMLARRPAAAVAAYARANELGRSQALVVKQHLAGVRAGQVAKADALLADWLKAQPQDHAVRAYWADTLYARGRLAEARREYEAILAAQPEAAAVLNNLAMIYLEQGEGRALELAERAHRLKPDDPLIADTLGWILVRTGQLERGLALLEQALGKAPDNATLRYHYAHGLADSNRLAEARRELARLRALPLTPELKARIERLAQRIS